MVDLGFREKAELPEPITDSFAVQLQSYMEFYHKMSILDQK